jgi:Zn-dependent metalloprotease
VKILKQGLSLALLGAGLAALPGLQVEASGQPAAAPDRSLVQQMRTEADGGVRVTNESATGKVGFIRAVGAQSDLFPDFAGNTTTKAVDKATAYLDRFGAAFGAADGQLEQAGVKQDRYGWTVSYTQTYKGVEVFGSMLKVNLDKAGDLTAVNGYAAPGLDLSVDPQITAATAGERAVGAVQNDPPVDDEGKAADTSGIKAKTTDLVVYRIGALKGDPGEAVLAYVVEVSNDDNVRDTVFVDAATNKVINRYSMVADGLERQLDEAFVDDNGTPEDPEDDFVGFDTVWEEGDDFPGSLNEDQQNLVTSASESYWMFSNTFDRDSYDGEGALMRTVNNDPRIACPNANWNGVTTNYCDDVTSDDVVSHEWGHAYTEYTSGLIYQYQPGALNESYSDVWGETLDLINGREDEGEGDLTLKRPDALCSTHTRGAIGATINSPESVAGPCAGAAAAAFGPVFDKTGVTTDVVVGTDAADDEGPTTTDGCSALTNAAAVAGKFVYVDRGTCTFAAKVAIAEDAGATGIVVGDNAPARDPISITGVSDIYGLMVTQADGTDIKSAGTVNMTIKDTETEDKADSFRWLVGEKSPAFGGAIRDMWNPTCYGDPGKVTDAEYNCDPNLDDSGGVHGNSGVPNHAYALVVDGGAFNGQTVEGIGIDKAANIWWRAQTTYLTPASDFVAAADALETSCTDLVGQPINEVTAEPEAGPTPADPVVAGDCTQLTNALTAVEMRTEPVQCNFQPMFDKNAPSVCGPGFTTKKVWSEDFENGLGDWEADFELGEGGGIHEPWVASTEAPGDHPGGVVYGPAPDEGQCSGDGVTDFSSRDSIVSPEVVLPVLGKSPRLSFDHYVATEAGFDGGNVKYSVNGGDFAVIPASAYLFNAPRALETAAAGNTNPLAGEAGFTGTDGGKVTGGWGQSQVNLAAVGAGPGDRIQLRFDVGRDGCGGIDGWYVDNVTISNCDKNAPTVTASTTTAKTVKKVKATKDFKVRVKVAKKPNGPAAGFVKILMDGKSIGGGKLDNGRVVITVKRNLPLGKHKLVAAYQGNGTTKPSKDPFTIRVIK